MKKCLLSIFFFMLFHSAYGYEQIYYPEEEYSSRYIIKDYSYINNYNQLWQELSSKIDITYYDEFIYKNFGVPRLRRGTAGDHQKHGEGK